MDAAYTRMFTVSLYVNGRKPSLDKEHPEVLFYEQNHFAFIHFISQSNPTEELIQRTFFVSPVNFISMQILVGGWMAVLTAPTKKKNTANTAMATLQKKSENLAML